VEGFWPIFFLAVVLKLPVLFAVWLVIWACRAYDADAEPPPGGSGGPRRRTVPRRPRGPRGPITPRRDPHIRARPSGRRPRAPVRSPTSGA